MSDIRTEVVEAARSLASAGLLIGSSGNVSARLGDRVFITASGVDLGRCQESDVIETDLIGSAIGGRRPASSELALHLGLYESPQIGAVVHTHAPYATAVACAPSRFPEVPVLHYQQMLLGGVIRVAPYETFGTPQLAEATKSALQGRMAALMANHGSVAVGSTLSKAVDNALLLEWLCALLLRVSAVAEPQTLTSTQQEAVVLQAIALNYGNQQETDS